jgi:hypothetical protein
MEILLRINARRANRLQTSVKTLGTKPDRYAAHPAALHDTLGTHALQTLAQSCVTCCFYLILRAISPVKEWAQLIVFKSIF